MPIAKARATHARLIVMAPAGVPGGSLKGGPQGGAGLHETVPGAPAAHGSRGPARGSWRVASQRILRGSVCCSQLRPVGRLGPARWPDFLQKESKWPSARHQMKWFDLQLVCMI